MHTKLLLADKYDEIKQLLEGGFTTTEIQHKLNLKYPTVLTDYMSRYPELIQLYQDVQALLRIKANKEYIRNKKSDNYGRWNYDRI